jgi:NADH-quinone oxidoreductase subunit K
MSLGLGYFLGLSIGLFAIGSFGLVAKRHLATIVMSLGLMLAATVVALSAFARFVPVAGHRVGGQAFAVVMALATLGEVGLGLALVRLSLRQGVSAFVDDLDR